MVRSILGILCFGLWLLSPAAPVAQQRATAGEAPKQSTPATGTVYVTKTVEKYHTAGCRSLAKSSIPMALVEAARRYGPCKVCKPPVPNATPAPALIVEQPAPEPKPAVSSARAQQCAATTKKGTRCSRNARAGSAFCWQHER